MNLQVRRWWPGRHGAMLAALVLLHLINSALAIFHDNLAATADGLDYLAWSGDVARSLLQEPPLQVIGDLFRNGERPPLAMVPAILLQLPVGGPDPLLARLSVLCWLPLLLLSVYLIGARLHSREAGLLAAAATAAMPIVMGFSRLLWLDFPLTAMVALAYLALLRSDGFSALRPSLAFGAVCGLGMLTKQPFPLFVAPAALLALVQGLRRPGRRAATLVRAAAAAALAAAILSTWLVSSSQGLARSIALAQSVDPFAETKVTTESGPLVSLLYYLEAIPSHLIGPLFFLLLVPASMASLRRRRWSLLALTGVWFFGSLLLLSIFISWSRYLMPALPAVALLIGAGLLDLPPVARFKTAAVPALVGLLALFAVQQTWAGPKLVLCHDEYLNAPTYRAWCAGLIRPAGVPRQRPDLSFMASMAKGAGAVLPIALAAKSLPPQYSNLFITVSEWVLVDRGLLYDLNASEKRESFNADLLRSLKILFIFSPGPAYQIPLDERDRMRQVRQWMAQEPQRWRVYRRIPFADGVQLTVHLNWPALDEKEKEDLSQL